LLKKAGKNGKNCALSGKKGLSQSVNDAALWPLSV